MKPEAKTGFWRARLRSFGCAIRGIGTLLRTQTNARIHLLATVAVFSTAYAVNIARYFWVLLSLAIGLVWVAEGLNTAIEILSDRITKEPDDHIRRAKDVAAGAVLISAIIAATIGIMVLGPRIYSILTGRG